MPGVVARKEGDAAAAIAGATVKLDAVYQAPFLAHTTMEPINCTVHVRPDGCEVWTGSQVLARAQATAAQVTGLPLEKVVRSEEHTSELQSQSNLVCRLL